MAWENALDRLILRQIHQAEGKEMRSTELERLLGDLLELGGARPQAYFHSGYAQALLGLGPGPEKLGLAPGSDRARWYRFGQLKAHDRKGEKEWVATLVEERGALLDLLRDGAIAWSLLPILLRAFFWKGDLDASISLVEFLEPSGGGGEGGPELIWAALTDILTQLERRPEPSEGPSNRELLRRCQAHPAYAALPVEVRARFELCLGRTYLEACEWAEAAACCQQAAGLAVRGSRQAAAAWTHLAWARLGVRGCLEIAPEPERPGREQAFEALERACADPERGLVESFFTRGLLAYEIGRFAQASADFDQALVLNRRGAGPEADEIGRLRFFQAAALLAGGAEGQARKAAYLMDQALERIRPDLNTFYTVHEPLKAVDRRVALKFLDAVEIERGASPDNLLMIALEYLGLAEAERATAAADRVLAIGTDLDQRMEALRVRLVAANMTGRPEAARSAYEALRDLLLRRGRFAEVEALLLDENLVGQAMDHIEVKCELIDLYEEMEGREAARSQLQLAVARSLRARKDLENLAGALAILRELEIAAPELAAEELETVGKLLELQGGGGEEQAASDPERAARALAEGLERRPRFLVVGGNERQRKHHPRFEALKEEWGLEGEWLMANYTSPQRLVAQVEEALEKGGLDGLLLLHWNRHETTEPALAAARGRGCPARTVFYAGFTSLRCALAQMLDQLARSLEAVGAGEERKGAGRSRGGKKRNAPGA